MSNLSPISGALGKKRAAHLLRRTTFGPNIAQIDAFATLGAEDALNQLLSPSVVPPAPIDPLSGTDWIHPNTPAANGSNGDLADYTKAWWMESMRTSDTNLTERMTWIYHAHFPMIHSRIDNRPQFAYDYIRLLRHYALGNFKKLCKAICIDNAMLVHLDGHLNIKSVPQENFAREFLELFTVGKGPEIGPGNYTTFTEQDVVMATKVLTGWGIDLDFATIDNETGIPTGKVKSNGSMATQHDISAKQFSSAFNNTVISTNEIVNNNATVQAVYDELDDFIDMIFDAPYTAINICKRLYRQLVYFKITPSVEQNIILPLAQVLRDNDYEISAVLETLLKSEHFYDEDNNITEDDVQGAIIKSPMDLVIGTIRLFELDIPENISNLTSHYALYSQLDNHLESQGLYFLEPYDVAGYDAYFQVPDFHRYWISANYLANRYKFIENIINGYMVMGDTVLQLDIVAFVKNNCSLPDNATVLISELCEWLFPITLDPDRMNYFKDAILLDQLSEVNWMIEWNTYIATNDDSNVRVQLETLAIAMMQSPEYQLY
ncbi:MAG: DUF1800 domain-containing protein [Crocinitomicaceae bacterium]|nr:DUF1800 domain-containing protein [Crocinitomicaceae bacterium]